MAGITEFARATPDAAAVVSLSRRFTFSEMDDRQRAVAGLLRAARLDVGDRITVFSANRPEVLETVMGALRSGIVPVPINPLLTAREVDYVIEDSGSRWMFTDRPVEHPALERVVTFGDAYERGLYEADRVELSGFVRGRPMHYTSGTTGHPKGVWVRPYSEERAAATSDTFRRQWNLVPGDVHLVCSPLAHSAPLRFSIRTLEAGGSVALQGRFDALETLGAIDLFGATTSFMVPTHLERIIALSRRELARFDLSSMRTLAHAGAPIREQTKRAAMDLFPTGSVWEFYGATEGQATRISSEEWLRKPGSVGRPLDGVELLVRDAHFEPVPHGDVGEIWIRDRAGDRFEYWRDPTKTDAAWRDDAFTVGDLGYLDDDNYLFLAGRKHDTIITGGVNVYPQEVERVLLDHPAVRDAAVYGAAHAEWGQEVRALVVATPEMPLDPDRLRTWARERLAGFKCPRRIEIVEDLPRTPTGKVKRPTA